MVYQGCWCRRDITEIEEMLTGLESAYYDHYLSKGPAP